MLKILKVAGESLSPDYEEGDYVVIATFPFLFVYLRPGDVVVFTHPAYGLMIKRVEHVENTAGDLWVTGTHPLSIDSRQFGAVKRRDVIGRVLWHIRKPGKGAHASR